MKVIQRGIFDGYKTLCLRLDEIGPIKLQCPYCMKTDHEMENKGFYNIRYSTIHGDSPICFFCRYCWQFRALDLKSIFMESYSN